jgi:hypothetical protein
VNGPICLEVSSVDSSNVKASGVKSSELITCRISGATSMNGRMDNYVTLRHDLSHRSWPASLLGRMSDLSK